VTYTDEVSKWRYFARLQETRLKHLRKRVEVAVIAISEMADRLDRIAADLEEALDSKENHD
jgi:hypothetical protein